MNHEARCSQERELHIVYVKARHRYRIVRQCPCKAFRALDRYLFRHVADAEKRMRAMPATQLQTMPGPRVRKLKQKVEPVAQEEAVITQTPYPWALMPTFSVESMKRLYADPPVPIPSPVPWYRRLWLAFTRRASA